MKTVNTISEMISLNSARSNTPALLSNGVFKYWIGGRWVSQKTFDKQRPKATYKPLNVKGLNAAKKNNFLNDQKSY